MGAIDNRQSSRGFDEKYRLSMALIKKLRRVNMVILGIDPGSFIAGFGVIRVHNNIVTYKDSGIIKVSKNLSFIDRLMMIGEELRKILELYRPHQTVIEQIFLGKNVNSAFRLGHVRGVCLFEVKKFGSEVVEYATRSVKKGLTSNGGADKDQVRVAVQMLLGISHNLLLDASDALALAYYHSMKLQTEKKFEQLKYL